MMNGNTRLWIRLASMGVGMAFSRMLGIGGNEMNLIGDLRLGGLRATNLFRVKNTRATTLPTPGSLHLMVCRILASLELLLPRVSIPLGKRLSLGTLL